MTTEIHAHKLLNFLRDTPMSKESLRDKALQNFGEGANFCTCSIKGFDLEAMLNFFEKENKIIDENGIWRLNLGEICSHD